MLNFRRDVEEFLRDLDEPLEAVIEAGRSSYGMADLLEELGVRVKMAHPSEVKAIARAKIKTDKRDSRVLADLLRAGLVPEVHKRPVETRRAQRVLRQRVFFVAMMTRVKNRNGNSHSVLGKRGGVQSLSRRRPDSVNPG